MKDLDKDLEELLRPLKDIRPSDFELQKWKSAASGAQEKFQTRRRFSRPWLQVAVAGVVGFIIGWAVFGSGLLHKAENKDFLADASNNATVEYVFTN